MFELDKSIAHQGLIYSNIEEAVRPNTIAIQCDEIILTKGGIKLEINCRLNPPLDQFEYIEINGVKFKKEE